MSDWRKPAAGGGSILDWRQVGTSPERYYIAGQMHVTDILVTIAPGTDFLMAWPYYEGRGGTLDRIAINVTTAAATAKVRVGIYETTSKTNLYPAALVVDSGELDAGSGGVKTSVINVALLASTLYWFAILVGNNNPFLRALAVSAGYPFGGIDAGLGTVPGYRWRVARAYGALPDPFTAGAIMNTTSDSIPCIGVRYSA